MRLVAIAATIALVVLAVLSWILWSKTRTLQRTLDAEDQSAPGSRGASALGRLLPASRCTDRHGEIHTLGSALAQGRRVVLVFLGFQDAGQCKSVGHMRRAVGSPCSLIG